MANRRLGKDSLFAIPVALSFATAVKATSLASSVHPVLSGALLWALTKAPRQYRDDLLTSLSSYASPTIISRSIATLKVLFGLGLARKLHVYLTELAENNFRFASEASKYDWPHEVALVTGAAGGIGAAIVTDLAAKGVVVIAVDIAPSLPDELAKLEKVHYRRCDITDRQAIMALAEETKAEHGSVSILVNNAGLAYVHHTLNATEANMRKLWDVNVLSHYWTLQAFLPDMIEAKKGHVVSTASMASFYPGVGLGPYSGTKVAALNIHESLAQELRQVHRAPEIKLTIVHPTFVRTAMTRRHRAELEKAHTMITPQDVSAGVCRNVFSGRGGQVILPGELGWIPTVARSLPHWLTYSLLRAVEPRRAMMEVEETQSQ